jgi:hypothetical protein
VEALYNFKLCFIGSYQLLEFVITQGSKLLSRHQNDFHLSWRLVRHDGSGRRASQARRFHHQPKAQHRPNSRLETAYHHADKGIQTVVDLLAAA